MRYFNSCIFSAGLQKKNNQRSEEHTSELQSQSNLVCRLLLEKKKKYDELNQKQSWHPQLHRMHGLVGHTAELVSPLPVRPELTSPTHHPEQRRRRNIRTGSSA